MKKIVPYSILHIILFLYSLSGVCSKAASSKPFLSSKFCLLYGASLFILVIYAILWQQVLKKIPLNIAYANKAITLVWGIIWGTVLFKEKIQTPNLIGAVIVIAGVLLVVTGGDKNKK